MAPGTPAIALVLALVGTVAAPNPGSGGLDPTVQVAFVGILTTIITTTGVVVVALVNNKKERGSAAEGAIVATLRERITLREEQILDLRADVAERDHTITQLREEIQLYKENRLP